MDIKHLNQHENDNYDISQLLLVDQLNKHTFVEKISGYSYHITIEISTMFVNYQTSVLWNRSYGFTHISKLPGTVSAKQYLLHVQNMRC